MLVLVSGFFASALHEPETITKAIVSFGEEAPSVITEPNPYYISGIQREVYEFAVDLLPTGQSSLLQNISIERPVRMLLCSAGVTAVFTLGGLRLFARKDLK